MGWTLDAFDFFLVVVVLRHVATDLHASFVAASVAVTLTLALRPVGALLFGWIADRYGRRIPLMIDVACFSVLELATAFSPNLTVFIALRALYGIAMGGEWGLGAALAMEALPAERRGLFSGMLQEGYACGYLLASLVFATLFTHIGWRGMFVIGTLPALLIFFIRRNVPESPVWLHGQAERIAQSPHLLLRVFKARWPLFVYCILFLAGMNFMSHGTQDPYVSAFLDGQHHFSPALAGTINVIANVGAIAGGICFGAFSQRFGRRLTIIACCVLALAVIPLWSLSNTIALLAIGGFLMQFMVQGAWGVIPAHLNEISPPELRGTFPGFTYQFGNLLAAGTLTIEAVLASQTFRTPAGHPNFAMAMAVFAAGACIFAALMAVVGYVVVPEQRNRSFMP